MVIGEIEYLLALIVLKTWLETARELHDKHQIQKLFWTLTIYEMFRK